MDRPVTLSALRDELQHFASRAHRRGMFVYDLIRAYSLSRCIDIGTRGGLVTSYMAVAVADTQDGKIFCLGMEGQRRQFFKSAPFLEGHGLIDRIDRRYHSHSLGLLLLELCFLESGELFDLIHINSGLPTHSMALIACLGERYLKPGGWVIFDRRPPADKLNGERPEVATDPSDPGDLTSVRIFEDLIGMSPYFADFRQDGDMLLARKARTYADLESRERASNALLVGEALSRSSEDIRFRMALKEDPDTVLSSLAEARSVGLRFEGGSICVPGMEQTGKLSYKLPETCWERAGRLESRQREEHT